MSNNILISDISLREYGKVDNFSLSFKEKLEVAKKLSELNVDAIELGPVSNEKADEILVKTISNLITKNVVSCTVGNTVESVNKTFSLIAGAKKKRLAVHIPVSPVQMEYYIGKKPKAVLELLGNLTKECKTYCEDVEVVLSDATRAEQNFLFEAIRVAISSGAKIVTLMDIAGTMLVEDFSLFLDSAYENVPELKNVKLGIEFSNTLSFASACYLTAMTKGASVLKISALGGFNLVSTETFFNAMDSVACKKGFTFNINKTGYLRILKQLHAIAFDKADAVIENAHKESVEIDKDVSKTQLNAIIKKLGYDLTSEDYEKVFIEYKRLSEKKDVNTLELDAIIASTALQVPETYVLEKFSVQTSNIINATANIVLKKDGKDYNGVAIGNGAVDASFRAIEDVLGRHFELDDFEISSITEGKGAIGQTIVKLRSSGKLYSGRGISTDIIGASIRAYINAVNKIVHEENSL